jgi:hypothetical protein
MKCLEVSQPGYCGNNLESKKLVLGETHPFYTGFHAANQAQDVEFPKIGKAILIEYCDFPFNAFDDLMKLVDKDVVIGQAFVAIRKAPNGISLFTLCFPGSIPWISSPRLIACSFFVQGQEGND